jgi:hypothetical protein
MLHDQRDWESYDQGGLGVPCDQMDEENGMSQNRWIVLIAVGLYLISLCLPVFLFDAHPAVMGHTLLFWGWWGLLTLNPAWLGNGLFVIALGFLWMKSYRLSWYIGGIGFLLGLTSFFVEEWWFNEGSGTPIAAYGAGFYVWLAALGGLAAGSKWMLSQTIQSKTL